MPFLFSVLNWQYLCIAYQLCCDASLLESGGHAQDGRATADCTTDKAHVRDLMHLYIMEYYTQSKSLIIHYSFMCNGSVLIIIII